MGKHNKDNNSCNTDVNVDVNVTEIVKYSCITSVLIVLIVFGSKVIKDIFRCD